MTDALAARLEGDPDLILADAAYTLRVGRRPFAHRRAVLAASAEAAAAALVSRDPRQVWTGSPRQELAGRRSVAFLLPGVGDQYPGLARGLYRDEPVFRQEIDRCAELLLPHLGLDLREVLFAAPEEPTQPQPPRTPPPRAPTCAPSSAAGIAGIAGTARAAGEGPPPVDPRRAAGDVRRGLLPGPAVDELGGAAGGPPGL